MKIEHRSKGLDVIKELKEMIALMEKEGNESIRMNTKIITCNEQYRIDITINGQDKIKGES